MSSATRRSSDRRTGRIDTSTSMACNASLATRAMQAAVLDMCERAYELGKSERIPELDGMSDEFRDMSVRCMELSVIIGKLQG